MSVCLCVCLPVCLSVCLCLQDSSEWSDHRGRWSKSGRCNSGLCCICSSQHFRLCQVSSHCHSLSLLHHHNNLMILRFINSVLHELVICHQKKLIFLLICFNSELSPINFFLCSTWSQTLVLKLQKFTFAAILCSLCRFVSAHLSVCLSVCLYVSLFVCL